MKKRKRTLRKKKQQSLADKLPKDARKAPSTFEEIRKDLKTASWGKDKLTREIEAAFCNIGVSFIKLKPHFELLQKANDIFLDAYELMPCPTLEGQIACSLFGRTASCFLGAVRFSCSGQITETWILLRACIENSIYAFYIFDNHERAEIWVNRHNDDESKRKCKQTFRVGEIWTELEGRSRTIAREAKDFYNQTIDRGAHPNERSLFLNLVPKQDDFLSQRILNPEPAFIKATILATVIACSLTFRIFTMIFPEVFRQANLKVRIQNLNQQSGPLRAGLAKQLRQLVSNKQKKAR